MITIDNSLLLVLLKPKAKLTVLVQILANFLLLLAVDYC